MSQPIIELKGIGKSFPGVRALDGINLSFLPGEIHAVVGENGAGKSTLMKILAGDYTRDEGAIFVGGEPTRLGTPTRARDLGIGMIHQELTLLPDRSIAQNIMLGREPRGNLGLVDYKAMNSKAKANLEPMGLHLDPATKVSTLPIAIRQMVEIAKALSLHARVLILDEPTSSLTEYETRLLLDMMKNLRDQGITLIYISHRLEEVFETADRITVLRDGTLIKTLRASETSPDNVIRLMVGRELGEMFVKEAKPQSDILLKVVNLSGDGFDNMSFELRKGEVLGISGLVGAGRSELARAIFGLDASSSGQVFLNGVVLNRRNVFSVMACGLVYVPEDRKAQGLFLNLSVRKNLTVNILAKLTRWGFLKFAEMKSMAGELIARLNVRPPDATKQIRNLSGGNQQKVVIAKWLSLNPRVLILDEPTRGIDVGAKAEIYSLIDRLAADGVGVIVISSELPEILGISDRVLVMKSGGLSGLLEREDATQDRIMSLAAGATL